MLKSPLNICCVGTNAVAVTAGSGCAWTAASNVGWITITEGASGTGSGTVGFAVAAADEADAPDVVVSLHSERIDVAGRPRAESVRLDVTADGTASTWRDGERLELHLSDEELEALRRDLAADLAELEPSIMVATDQGSTTVRVVHPESDRTLETTLVGAHGPEEFHRAVDRLVELVERIVTQSDLGEQSHD